jgi:hypothetical protein
MTVTLRFAATAMLSAFFLCPYASTLAPTPAPPQASSQDGLQLLHRMQSALGGADKIAAIQDYEETVRAEVWNNDGVSMGEVHKRTRWMRKHLRPLF